MSRALEHPGGPSRSSPRNELPATITAITADGPVTRVDLDAGFPLAAYVTGPTAEELDLHRGQKITALIKATAVHLIARSATPRRNVTPST